MEECRSFEEFGLDGAAVELDGAAVVGTELGTATEVHVGIAEDSCSWVVGRDRNSEEGIEGWILSLLFLAEMWTALTKPAA